MLDWKNNSKCSKTQDLKKQKTESVANTNIKKIGLYFSTRILPIPANF